MKIRIAILSGSLALAAGAAAAIPTTDQESAAEPSPVLFTWDEFLGADLSALAPPPVQPESMEIAVYGPCGCTPRPPCPFPFPFPRPWPGGPEIFFPFPIPDPCGPCPY